MSDEQLTLSGVRVVELADERAEYVGLILSGLGAEVIKVEPPGGTSTRGIGPFYEDVEGPERSLYFWTYNRGKKSVVIDLPTEQERFLQLLETADVLIDSSPRDYLGSVSLSRDSLLQKIPGLVIARMTDFGDDGPWANYRGSDLVHLALGGEMMLTGYSPRPDGTYDLPPIAGQVWNSYHIAGEQLAAAIVAALYYRQQTGQGQLVSCAIHDAVSKNTEQDVANWVMRRVSVHRQTCDHAREHTAPIPPIVRTKDGRWLMVAMKRELNRLKPFLERYDISNNLSSSQEEAVARANGIDIPGSSDMSERDTQMVELVQRLIGRFTYEEAPWKEAQEAGLMFVPIRRPEENVGDEHWKIRRTFSEIEHPEIGRSLTYVTSKWVSTATEWKPGRRAPLIDEDRQEVLASLAGCMPVVRVADRGLVAERKRSPHGKPFLLDGIRVFDFSWHLASAGGTRFLAALGAEVIKVEWSSNPDTRLGAMAPIGGREARRVATDPLPPVANDADMGGQFNNKNPGKLGMSLNVRHPEGLAIARRLVAISDVVAEGFSPGVLNRWGLGYSELCGINPSIIYAQQSGMGSLGTYGRFRAVGPIAASLAGLTDMAGLPDPVMPSGWGYSYLDWIGAYSFSLAIMSALYYRERTGKGQWIDASQTETGIFLCGMPVLDWSANGRLWTRTGNRSPWLKAAPHGAYRCAGSDRWVAIACFSEDDWQSFVKSAGHLEWATDRRFTTLQDRLANQDALDAEVTRWTSTRDRYDVMMILQESGVAAGVCQTAEDKCDEDPQLAALEWLTEVVGTKIGEWPVAALPVKMSETPPYVGGPVGRGAPCYGEDNEWILGELLGFSSQEIERLAGEGVI